MLATLRFGVVSALAMSLGGCAYIGPALYGNVQNCIDADEDGAPRTPQVGDEFEFQCPGLDKDCDDDDPERYPDREGEPHLEIPYDAIDQNCDDVDLVDVDDDGFPGISQADWDAITRDVGDLAAWPAGLPDGNTLSGKGANFDCDDDPAGDDPNDSIPDANDVKPDSKESFGDGIDQDCSCLDTKAVCDDYDSDGDGYVLDIYKNDSTLPGGDCDDGEAKVNPGVKASDDVPYDGVDSNCDAKNDFDIDGDGYMPDAFGSMSQADWQAMFFQFCKKFGGTDSKAGTDPDEYIGCYEVLYDVSKAPEWGDCADSEDDMPSAVLGSDEVFPGATDAFYDGIDANCNGDNDFDADGDLYISDEWASDYVDYMSFWGIVERSCHEASRDRLSCDDGIDNNKTKDSDPLEIDGADPLCLDPDNLGIEGPLSYGICGGNDCDDDDADVHPNDYDDDRPGTMEVLGDAFDQDCDSGNNTTHWQYGGFGWDEPRNVVVGHNKFHYLLTTAATETDAAPYKNAGLTLAFDPVAAADEDPVDKTTWFVPNTNGKVQTVGGRVDMVAPGLWTFPAPSKATDPPAGPTEGFYATVSYTDEPTTCSPQPCVPSPSTYTMVKMVYWDLGQGAYRNKIVYRLVSSLKDTYPDVDLRLDGDNNVWGFACGPQTLAYVVGDSTSAFGYKSKGCYGAGNCDVGPISPANPNQCFMDPPIAGQSIAKGTLCTGTACTTYDLDGRNAAGAVTLSATQPYSALTYPFSPTTHVSSGVDWQNGYRTIVPQSGNGVQLIKDGDLPVTVLSSFAVKAAAVDEFGGKLYIVAVVADQTADGKEDVIVAYGPASGTVFTTAIMPLIIDDGVNVFTFDPNEVSIYADGDRVMLGVSGKKTGGASAPCLSPTGTFCDIVAWAFLGPQG